MEKSSPLGFGYERFGRHIAPGVIDGWLKTKGQPVTSPAFLNGVLVFYPTTSTWDKTFPGTVVYQNPTVKIYQVVMNT